MLLEQTSILLCGDSQLLRVLVGFMQSLNSDSSQTAAQQGVMHSFFLWGIRGGGAALQLQTKTHTSLTLM